MTSKKQTYFEAYKHGDLLRAAPDRFAPPDLVDGYSAAQEHEKQISDARVRDQAEALRSGRLAGPSRLWLAQELGIDLRRLENDESYLRKLSTDDALLHTQRKHSSQYLKEMRDLVANGFRDGTLKTYGYERAISVNDGPGEIPNGILQSISVIDWVHSTLASGDIKFMAVRVLSADSPYALADNADEIGRPSTIHKTVRIYQQLLGTGEITEDDSPKVITGAIAAKMKNPPKPRTIWDHIQRHRAQARNK